MGKIVEFLMRYVIIRRLLAYSIGAVFAIPVLLSLFIAIVKSRGKFLQSKRRREKPACLDDPVYGEHRVAHLEEVSLHYVVSGPEDKPLLVLVHGFPECWYSWRYQIKEFQTDFRVVAIDQRGYNTSTCPTGVSNYTVDKLVKDVKQLISTLCYDKCTLVGHDWGGVACWGVAIKHPELVERLVIMNAPHPSTFLPYLTSTLSQFRKSWYMFLFQLPYLPEVIYGANDMASLKRVFMGRRSGVRSDKMTTDDLEAYKYVFYKNGSFTGPLNYIRALTRTRDLVTGPSHVNCPTLILWGDCDQFLDTGLVKMASPYVRDLQSEIVEGASHWVQMDQPEVVNKHMRAFFDRK